MWICSSRPAIFFSHRCRASIGRPCDSCGWPQTSPTLVSHIRSTRPCVGVGEVNWLAAAFASPTPLERRVLPGVIARVPPISIAWVRSQSCVKTPLQCKGEGGSGMLCGVLRGPTNTTPPPLPLIVCMPCSAGTQDPTLQLDLFFLCFFVTVVVAGMWVIVLRSSTRLFWCVSARAWATMARPRASEAQAFQCFSCCVHPLPPSGGEDCVPLPRTVAWRSWSRGGSAPPLGCRKRGWRWWRSA